MHDPSTEPETLSIRRLRDAVKGEVIAPDDREYDDARAVYYGVDRRPAWWSGPPTRTTSPR